MCRNVGGAVEAMPLSSDVDVRETLKQVGLQLLLEPSSTAFLFRSAR